ncbi:MAG: PEP-CTERM sorting domain-containing protein [Ectothiorhodospiraceae bacterium]|nr:PEP-CTERM sorting domain-containing protein [Chromatiales bacterium]MCP5155735.1 PEP-CTERM sorting domain-containing protein [Ectothiorhodospiraceae bacterium]
MNVVRLTTMAVAPALLLAAAVAQAVPVIGYEWTEGGPGAGVNSPHVSRHGVRGPVLADDFQTAVEGRVVRVDWWGSGPLAGAPDPDEWEITFHYDDAGVPAQTAPSGGFLQFFANTSGDGDPDGDGVHEYSAAVDDFPILVKPGGRYWFSVANFQCTTPGTDPDGPACDEGWTWGYAGGAGPTVGAEAYDPVVSFGVGPNGGPHFGPWNVAEAGVDFAFRIWVEPEVPEPLTLGLMAIGVVAAGAARRRRTSA